MTDIWDPDVPATRYFPRADVPDNYEPDMPPCEGEGEIHECVPFPSTWDDPHGNCIVGPCPGCEDCDPNPRSNVEDNDE